MYCPNCNSPVPARTELCLSCGADFSTNSNWKPVSTPAKTDTKPPLFSGKPKLVHAGQSIAIFVCAGPLLGLVMLAMTSSVKGGLAYVLHPFLLIGAFAGGGIPALLAGVLYCCVALALICMVHDLVIGTVAGAAIGFVAGGIAGVCYSELATTGIGSPAGMQIAVLSMAAGTVCGLMAGWLVPIGRSTTPNSAA